MSGHGFAPKDPATRRNRSAPQRGEWQASPGIGWQHGTIPDPPQGLVDASVAAWRTWFQSWFAALWIPGDVPGLRIAIQLHDEVIRGKSQRAPELRLWLDNYGVTHKGQADRRWTAPEAEDPAPRAARRPPGQYGHLRAVSGQKTGDPKVVGESARRTAGGPATAPAGTPTPDDLAAINERLRQPEGDAS